MTHGKDMLTDGEGTQQQGVQVCRAPRSVRTAKEMRPDRLAYQPPASSSFLSQQTSHQQPVSSTFLSEQISTSH
jgi:hypothetical protein